MKEKDAKIFISSMSNVSKRLEHYGDANIMNVSMLKLIYKYAEYSTTQKGLKDLDSKVSFLQKTDPDICMEYASDKGYVKDSTFNVVSTEDFSNQAPTLAGISISVVDEGYYITRDALLENYDDPENTIASLLIIESVPANGNLFLNNVIVTAGQVIDISKENIVIAYVRNSNLTYTTSFNFSVFDSDSQVPLQSNISTVTLNSLEIIEPNLAPTVGDTNLYTNNRASRVFTVADFTTSAIPQYTDPEADGLDAVRIDKISNTNTGEYLFYGTPIVLGQVITAEDLNDGAFTYISPDSNSIKTDVIEVSVRDTGSMIWVS